MLYPTASRTWNGVEIEGQRIGVQMQPLADGTISVTVIAQPEITGFDRACRLSDDAGQSFSPDEIKVHDARLECLAVSRYAPVLRSGFVLELEPGMAQLVRAWLDKLVTVAEASKALADAFSAQLPPPIHHMFDAITKVVARIALDGWDIDHAIAYEREHGTWAREQAFMTLFDDAGAQQILRGLREPIRGATAPRDGAAKEAVAVPKGDDLSSALADPDFAQWASSKPFMTAACQSGPTGPSPAPDPAASSPRSAPDQVP